MKKYYFLIIAVILLTNSCTDWLVEESETNVTVVDLYSTPEGIQKATTALYEIERGGFWSLNTPNWYACDEFLALIEETDLTVNTRLGGYGNYRLIDMQTGAGIATNWWNYQYNLIGKANEIIYYGEKLVESHPELKKSIAVAKYFRAHAYFWLFRKYDRIWLNTTPTTPDNVNEERIYKPANEDDIYKQINEDLEYAIQNLSGEPKDAGNVTDILARHIKADVAMWQKNYDEAIKQVQEIEKNTDYGLEDLDRLFTGGDLNHKEALYIWRSARIGGTDYNTLTNRMQSHFIPWYDKVCGERSFENGGWGWGWCYPNDYYFSLFDQNTDLRFKKLCQMHYIVTKVVEGMPAGTQVGDTVKVTEENKSLYYEAFHPTTKKFIDTWTVASPDDGWSFKDFMVYRLAETYLFAAEAYMRKGDNTNALKYYNKTWMRAGNPEFKGIVTEDMIMDEQARELGHEGHRWFFLKRIGKLLSQVRNHAGEENHYTSTDFTSARTNIQDFMVRWPLPDTELIKMGKENFPQNPGYNP